MWKQSECSRGAESEFSLRHSLARGRHEGFEQRSKLAGSPEIFRMPLDAEAEPRLGLLDRFDDAVGRGGRGNESRPKSSYGLVVPTVDAAARRSVRRDAESGGSSISLSLSLCVSL